MINIKTLHWVIQREFNKVNNDTRKGFNDYVKDNVINIAQYKVLNFYLNEFLKTGINKDLYAPFEIYNYNIKPVLNTDSPLENVYILEYPEDMFHLRDGLLVKTKECGIYRGEIIHSKDSTHMGINSYNGICPIFKTCIAIQHGTNNKVQLELRMPKGVIPTMVYINYLRKPNNVFSGNYDTIEYLTCTGEKGKDCDKYYNKSSNIVHCEFDEAYLDTIVSFSVKELAVETNNINKINITNPNIIS